MSSEGIERPVLNLHCFDQRLEILVFYSYLRTMNLSVAHISVILKLCLLVVVAFGAESAIIIIKSMTNLQLKRTGCTPIAFKNDIHPFKARSTITKFCSSGTIGLLIIIVISIALLPAEMYADFGVRNSRKCTPKATIHDKKAGNIEYPSSSLGICAASPYLSGNRTHKSRSNAVATAYIVSTMRWNDEHLVQYGIRQGLHRSLTGDEYFGYVDEPKVRSDPVVVSNCSVLKMANVLPENYEMGFGQQTANSEGMPLKSITVNKSITYEGMGSVTNNYQCYSAFLVVAHSPIRLTLYEYPSTVKLRDVHMWTGHKNITMVKPSAVMMAYDISCGKTSLSTVEFMESVYSYRFAQLSAPTRPTCIEDSSAINMNTQHMNASDVVRAVLATKLNEETVCPGTTYEYTQCGIFEPVTILPLLAIVVFLMCLAVIFTMKPNWAQRSSPSTTTMSSSDDEDCEQPVRAPITATEWSRFAMGSWSSGKTFMRADSPEYKAHIEMVGDRNCIGEYVVAKDEETGKKRLQMNEIVVITPEEENVGRLKRMATNALKRARPTRRLPPTGRFSPTTPRPERGSTMRPGSRQDRISLYRREQNRDNDDNKF